ncbi:hypothetical protein GCM10018793_35300 [Streptomyces sulfonofaciens]|uniref:DUF6924 domain-containing protein n=1 Tax=Streptomyces sulfonofaciens TaxID=68272 RepID=A0A919G9L1_9ACTN|nr:hypothetical protein [Streptomyces sulfonofaciens]GHH80344.1 hypothetical protein GCM10018793_35300 [Streptomyces sulfonofaciens]
MCQNPKWGDGEFEATVHVVDDPGFAGVSTEDLPAAVGADTCPYPVFVADRTTMQADHHALLAVTTATPELVGDDTWYEEMVQYGGQFRTVPGGVSEIHANLYVSNMDFQEFAGLALDDPEGVHRSF